MQLCSDTTDGLHFDGLAEDATITVTRGEGDRVEVDVDATITNGFDGWNDGGGFPTAVRARFAL